ncbi:predicted protein [Botrytis cinerea T4]|uniref:Uncharacterized protein n=1 Tax=Botryotinia fuckeliana (strain T4) TaxID=999810 RepID=G2XU95_BOTF4|nr:predicted protein [Botrytis cinerea T4]
MRIMLWPGTDYEGLLLSQTDYLKSQSPVHHRKLRPLKPRLMHTKSLDRISRPHFNDE